jgi:hypothetical protein
MYIHTYIYIYIYILSCLVVDERLGGGGDGIAWINKQCSTQTLNETFDETQNMLCDQQKLVAVIKAINRVMSTRYKLYIFMSTPNHTYARHVFTGRHVA